MSVRRFGVCSFTCMLLSNKENTTAAAKEPVGAIVQTFHIIYIQCVKSGGSYRQ